MKKGTILIVEDQEINRKLLCRLFQEDYEILEAADGVEAEEQLLAHEGQIAAVLLDIIMPRLDGFGVMEFMKNRKMMEQLPVVLITGDTSNASKDKAFSLGASDVIEKPYDPFIIRKRISNLVELWMHKSRLEQLVNEQTAKIQ